MFVIVAIKFYLQLYCHHSLYRGINLNNMLDLKLTLHYALIFVSIAKKISKQ